MSYSDRLKDARTAAGLTQTELAKRIGLKSNSLIANLETKSQKSTTRTGAIAKVLGVSPLWLETGEGSRHSATEPLPESHWPSGEEESTLLRAYRLASPPLRRSLIRQAEGILDDLDNPSQLTGTDPPAPE